MIASPSASLFGRLDAEARTVLGLQVACSGRCLDAIDVDRDPKHFCILLAPFLGDGRALAYSRLLIQYEWTPAAASRLKGLYEASNQREG